MYLHFYSSCSVLTFTVGGGGLIYLAGLAPTIFRFDTFEGILLEMETLDVLLFFCLLLNKVELGFIYL